MILINYETAQEIGAALWPKQDHYSCRFPLSTIDKGGMCIILILFKLQEILVGYAWGKLE
jgi:hypothetical protein